MEKVDRIGAWFFAMLGIICLVLGLVLIFTEHSANKDNIIMFFLSGVICVYFAKIIYPKKPNKKRWIHLFSLPPI